MHLSDASLRALPFMESGQKDYPDPIIPGFTVRVGTRSKTFRLVAGSGRERQIHTLGRYDPPRFTLAMAREKARDILAARRLNPEPPKPRALIFRDALQTFYATHLVKQRPSSQAETRRLIDRHFSVLEKLPLNRIETAEVIAITDALINTPSEANHAFTAARTFFRWAVKRRLIDRSPLDGCDLPASEGSRDRAAYQR